MCITYYVYATLGRSFTSDNRADIHWTHYALYIKSTCFAPDIYYIVYKQFSKAFIRNPLSLLAHERSRFANCQWELLTPNDIRIPLTHRLVLYTLEAGDCLFCVQFTRIYLSVFTLFNNRRQNIPCAFLHLLWEV